MADKRKIAELNRPSLPATLLVTPPETVYPASTTPSVGLAVSGVDKIIAEIRNRICGQAEVEEEWYDYFPQLAKFVLRMPGTVHEAVIGAFEGLFLADDYILGSNGLTQAVIGIDLIYQGKEARVIVWRPNKTKEKGETTLIIKETFKGTFRDANGNLVNGKKKLQIWLKDFSNQLDYSEIRKVQGEITISFTQLYELVQESEAFEQALKRRRGSDEVLEGRSRQRMVKQKLVRPSQEKLGSTDKKRFEAMEEEAEKQLSDQD
ncbi:hypothetical protein B0T26DRAFT_801750 [Lasiosphaeria miniovina]|uniref:Uncharacterized protein n=1 Tax=Lasiosphaeria miniovina TaxID=1954250 RepID=A0AA40AW62_9PEZI|nr:uncharacterized protein B0T26DRAFT_801750 [Lasiosphaeria miniovina]KAK0723135.1 hypothetical protein B0T26DRAFT_801750 [Lasiosphaeria miniovina]